MAVGILITEGLQSCMGVIGFIKAHLIPLGACSPLDLPSPEKSPASEANSPLFPKTVIFVGEKTLGKLPKLAVSLQGSLHDSLIL